MFHANDPQAAEAFRAEDVFRQLVTVVRFGVDRGLACGVRCLSCALGDV